ncbi:MAG: hypothetical protein JXR56_00515, partial [Candidatus Cloacimonetes bacterium]|nr:hypothetical protein [Candidatus Cloacimonadota bacterium]
MEFSIELEKYWRHKISKALKELRAEKSLDYIHKHNDYSKQTAIDFTMKLFDVMREELSEEKIIHAVTACGCEYPKQDLEAIRLDYLKHQDLERVHAK